MKRNLYIAVDPVGSLFAKRLQAAVRDLVVDKVFRVSPVRAVDHARRGRQVFQVTPRVLNKIEQFQQFHAAQVSCPKSTTTVAGLAELGKTVFARTLINSTGGRGIVEFANKPGEAPPRAPFYTEYIPKKAEYRVHVFGNQAIDFQQKKKRKGFEGDRDTRVRNLENGYVYTRENIVLPNNIGDLAIAAVAACGYSYGAVDIIYNEKQDKCFVLEVNSRPGLMGTTCEKYANALVSLFNLRRKM